MIRALTLFQTNMKKQSLPQAFSNAFNGLFFFLRCDRNGRIHLAVSVLVSGAGLYFQVSATEWLFLLACFAMVPCFEMMNYALEQVCDVAHPSYHPLIRIAKDVAAAAVLWSALVSVAIGLVIFIPKTIQLL